MSSASSNQRRAAACAPAIALAGPFFSLWINPEFGASSGPVAAILLFSVAVNGAAFFPFVLLQAEGRPGVAARFHLLEVVPFLLVLWAGIHFLGLIGAALAWCFRVSLDALLLYRATRLRAVGIAVILLALLVVVVATLVVPVAGMIIAVPLTFWFGVRAVAALAPHLAIARKLVDRFTPGAQARP